MPVPVYGWSKAQMKRLFSSDQDQSIHPCIFVLSLNKLRDIQAEYLTEMSLFHLPSGSLIKISKVCSDKIRRNLLEAYNGWETKFFQK